MIERKKWILMAQGQRGLPLLYQPIDYIWGDGRQRIVTNVLPDDNDIWEVDCKLLDISENTGVFGAGNVPQGYGINSIGTNTNLSGFFVQVGFASNYSVTTIAKDTNRHKHLIDIPQRKYYIDDALATDFSIFTYVKANCTYGLWHHTESVTAYSRYTSGRIYHCSIRGRMDLWPCIRLSDGKPGMYDLKSRTFYVNVGTGEFHVDDLVDCMDLDSCWIADTATHRKKTESGNNAVITKTDGILTLTRTDAKYGLDMVLGYLESGKTYKISGTFGFIDGNAYIAKVNGRLLESEFTSSRKATTSFSNGSVSFTPSESGIYELLVWNSGTHYITAENVSVTEV